MVYEREVRGMHAYMLLSLSLSLSFVEMFRFSLTAFLTVSTVSFLSFICSSLSFLLSSICDKYFSNSLIIHEAKTKEINV
jgi:hypothetical protein